MEPSQASAGLEFPAGRWPYQMSRTHLAGTTQSCQRETLSGAGRELPLFRVGVLFSLRRLTKILCLVKPPGVLAY